MTKPKFNEDTLSEKPAIEQLKRLEYNYIHGDELDPELAEDCERSSRKEVILIKRLKKKLADINPHLTEESIDKVIRKITHIHEESILEANRRFHRYLISGDSVDQDIGARRQKQTVNFIDFENIENNEFLVVNQFFVKGLEPCRPDIVIFVNGIPLVVIECKSPVAKNTAVIDALNQLIRYQDEIPHLFHANAFLIGCNLFGAKYGVIGNARDDFQEWKDLGGEKFLNMAEHPSVKEMLTLGLIDKKDIAKDPPMQEILIAGLLKKRNLLDIVRNFIVFDYSQEEHKVIKKISRYQQFSAVNKIVKRVTEEKDKRGIIWHWQGSGKSLIMVFAAVKLRREEKKLKNPMILVVTDRTKLDRQIIEKFLDCSFPNPIRAKSMKELYQLLSGGIGNTVMTTVQKFREPLQKPLSEAENIIVLTDEAHRTQYGNFALNLRKALPNASFFAFTGTPLNKRDRNTYRHFSPPNERYLDRYDIHQSKADRATVDVKYEGRLANLQIVGNSIDRLLKELFPEKTQKELAEIKRKYATIETLLSAPRRIELVTRDIVDHYVGKILPNGFKALVVARDRNAADTYKKAFDKLIDPTWSTIVMSVNNDDSKEWKQKYKRTAEEEDYLSGKEVFQNPEHALKMIIVVDKLLTGFDAPILQAMYLDQRTREHTLLQAIARTNRPYHRKNYGLVVDYVGVGKELATALAIFDKVDLEGLFSIDDLKLELEALKDSQRKALALFKGINRSDSPDKVIQKCLEILGPEDVRIAFDELFRAMAKSIDILMPDPCVDPYLGDFKFLGTVREGARNLYRDERLSLEDCAKKVEALIHAHIQDKGVEELLAPISITAPDFEEKLGVKGDAKAKASHVEYAIRETISVKAAEDPHFYQSLQGQLESVLEEYRIQRKDEADLLKELVKLKDQEERKATLARNKGLSDDEFAFYGLLEPYGDGLFPGDDKKMCDFVKKMIEIVSEKTRIIDWVDKPDIQKEMRREIKELLKGVGFESEKMESFTREVVELAKNRLRYSHGLR